MDSGLGKSKWSAKHAKFAQESQYLDLLFSSFASFADDPLLLLPASAA